MAIRKRRQPISPDIDADEALASILDRISDYVIIEPRDTSFPVPILGMLSKPSRVRVVERKMSPEEDMARIWETVGDYLWSVLPPPEELVNSEDRETE